MAGRRGNTYGELTPSAVGRGPKSWGIRDRSDVVGPMVDVGVLGVSRDQRAALVEERAPWLGVVEPRGEGRRPKVQVGALLRVIEGADALDGRARTKLTIDRRDELALKEPTGREQRRREREHRQKHAEPKEPRPNAHAASLSR